MWPSPVFTPAPVNWDFPLNRFRSLWLHGIPPLDGGSTWWDLCGRNHGALIGNPRWVATARWDSGLLLDGSTQYAQCPVINAVTGYSISVWLSLAAGAPESHIVSNDNGDSSSTRGWQFRVDDPTGTLRLIVFTNGNTNFQAVGVTDLRGAGWHHLAGTWDGITAKVYVGGLEEGSVSASGTYSNTTNAPLLVGSSAGFAQVHPLPGFVSSPSVWLGRALSKSDVYEDFIQGKSGNPDTLLRPVARVWFLLSPPPPPPPPSGIVGTVSLVQDPDTVTAAGLVSVTGVVGYTQSSQTVHAAGTTYPAPPDVTPGGPEQFFRTLTGQDRRVLRTPDPDRTFRRATSSKRVWNWSGDMARKVLTLESWAGERKTFGFDYSSEGAIRDGETIVDSPPPTVTVDPPTGFTVESPEVLVVDFFDSDGKKVEAGAGFKVGIQIADNFAGVVTVTGTATTSGGDLLKIRGKLSVE